MLSSVNTVIVCGVAKTPAVSNVIVLIGHLAVTNQA